MTPERERVDKRLQNLTEVIEFTENLGARIHGLRDKTRILSTLVQESLNAGKCCITVYLLDDDRCHLRLMEGPSSPLALDRRARADAAGVAPLTRFAVNVDESAIWRPVIREGRIVQCRVTDLVQEMFPPPAADLILEATDYRNLSGLLAPLQPQDDVIGALHITSTHSGTDLLPCVRHLVLHVNQALALAEASALCDQAEQALRERETILSAVLNATSEAIFLADAHYTILMANEAMATRFGMSLDRLVGSSALDILPPEVAAARRALANRELPSGQPFRFEDERNDRVVEISAYPVCDAQGKVEKIAVFSHDITELRRLNKALQESERRFQQMADVMPTVFWIATPDWSRILYMSAAFDRIYGFPREECYRQPSRWINTLHPDDRAAALAYWKEHHGQAGEYRHRIVRADGGVRWVREVTSPVRSETGELLLLAGYVEDVTDRVQAEAQVRQAEKMAALGVLAGGIAHSLRNPLSVISACAQILNEYPDDKPLSIECAQKINAATQRASQIIENLLRLARPQDVPLAVVDLATILQDAQALLADHLLMQRISLEQKLERGLPAVRGNPPLLEQVVVDLVLNACNAMPNGGTLTISAAAVEPGSVEIVFQDTGCGIAPENLSWVFDPFFTTSPDGVGLGLSICYAIIRQHGGTIAVESEVGRGTTFTIRLPAAGEE